MDFKYDEIIRKIPFKYAIPVMVAKRTEEIIRTRRKKDTAMLADDIKAENFNPLVETKDGNDITAILKEIELGLVKPKNPEIFEKVRTEVK